MESAAQPEQWFDYEAECLRLRLSFSETTKYRYLP